MKFRVVAVDDDRDTLKLLGLMLKRVGDIDLIPVTDPFKFVECVAEIQPEAAITDDRMPGIDGLTLVRQLKADLRTEHIPIILWAISSDPVQYVEFMEAGGSDILIKPTHPEETLECVCACIARGAWDTLPKSRWKEVFLPRLADKKAFWRAAMVRCFAEQTLPDFLLERFERLLADPAVSVRQQVLRCLSHSDAPELLPLQLKLSQESQEEIREAALRGLARQDAPAVVTVLAEALHDNKLAIRKIAFQGLQAKTHEAILPALTDALAEEDDELRWEIAIAITHRLDRLARPFWVRHLIHADVRIRADAEAMLKAMSRAGAAAGRL